MNTRVECYSGATYAERPTALWWEDQRLEVEAVESRWRSPNARTFHVRTVGGRRFEVHFDEQLDSWQVHPLEPAPISAPK